LMARIAPTAITLTKLPVSWRRLLFNDVGARDVFKTSSDQSHYQRRHGNFHGRRMEISRPSPLIDRPKDLLQARRRGVGHFAHHSDPAATRDESHVLLRDAGGRSSRRRRDRTICSLSDGAGPGRAVTCPSHLLVLRQAPRVPGRLAEHTELATAKRSMLRPRAGAGAGTTRARL